MLEAGGRMIRSIFKGALLLAVVGAGYWYLRADESSGSGDLLHTPAPALKKGAKGERVAKAKAKMKASTAAAKSAAKQASAAGKKLAAHEPVLPKKSSNKAFAGLKASSLVPVKRPKPKAVAPKKVESTTLAARGKAPVSSGAFERVDKTEVPGFSLARIALAHEVENREPTKLASSFVAGTRVHLFMEAKNLGDQDQTLVVRWHDPAVAAPVSIPLKVPARRSRYRTWANSSPLLRKGTHEVSVQVKGGPEIFRRSFTVLAAELPAAKKLNDRAAR